MLHGTLLNQVEINGQTPPYVMHKSVLTQPEPLPCSGKSRWAGQGATLALLCSRYSTNKGISKSFCPPLLSSVNPKAPAVSTTYSIPILWCPNNREQRLIWRTEYIFLSMWNLISPSQSSSRWTASSPPSSSHPPSSSVSPRPIATARCQCCKTSSRRSANAGAAPMTSWVK